MSNVKNKFKDNFNITRVHNGRMYDGIPKRQISVRVYKVKRMVSNQYQVRIGNTLLTGFHVSKVGKIIHVKPYPSNIPRSTGYHIHVEEQ